MVGGPVSASVGIIVGRLRRRISIEKYRGGVGEGEESNHVSRRSLKTLLFLI
jgi:hypothetical protein